MLTSLLLVLLVRCQTGSTHSWNDAAVYPGLKQRTRPVYLESVYTCHDINASTKH